MAKLPKVKPSLDSAPPAAPLSLLQSTEQAFALAGKGGLPIVELFNAAQCLTDAKHPDIATDLYRLWLANTNSPIAYAVQFNLAVMLDNASDDNGAEAAYRAALAQKPGFIEGGINLANLLERTRRQEEALSTWRTMLASVNVKEPADRGFHLQALNNLGRLLENRDELPEAMAMLTRSLKEDPNQKNVMTHWVHLRQKLCEWPVYGRVDGVTVSDMVAATSSLAMLGVSDDPVLQLQAAQRYVNEKVLKDVPHYMSSRQSYGHNRLRIGYLSSDFCSHAVSILTAELYGLHDRAKVEVFGFCWSNDDGSPLRARVVAGMDRYVKIGTLSDKEAACLIRSHEIDVLVDLHGLTRGTRHNILSYRPAPVQIAWLGFPGPTALPEIDYVLADPFVFPPELEPFFTEKPLRMPHTFQINDRQRIVGPRPTRESCGLSADAFVFCSFNSSFKLTPEVFGSWMRILKRVPGSLLWLMADNDQVRENLSRAAEMHGIASTRLCFATRVAPADYLARYQLADLFLDTFPFGAGTTGSDALWAGLPLLTYAGRSFASRMAGSLLRAVDLPELIADSLQDYEEKAVALGLDRAKIDTMKCLLDENRLTCILFDSPRFVRDLETLYRQVSDELPAAPAKPDYLGVNLGYIELPSAAMSLRLPHHINDRRYVIAAPPFQHNSAGIRVLYELQKWLVRAGLDAIVCTWTPDYPVDQFVDDIVIYPEVAPGNLLKATRVIRYILNVPGKLGYGEAQYDKNEVLVAYNKQLAPYSNGVILQVPSTEPFFHAQGAVKTKNAVFVGKGQDSGLHPADCIAITKEFPATRREVAQFLRSVNTIYMYDDFSMIGHEANLCGCDVKLIQKDGAIVEYPQYFYPTIEEFKVQLHEFIEMTKRL